MSAWKILLGVTVLFGLTAVGLQALERPQASYLAMIIAFLFGVLMVITGVIKDIDPS